MLSQQDQNLLSLLRQNARASISELARALDLSGTPSRGDVAESLETPPGIEYASSFQPPG
jgi:DNA-binding Lrp family transcriptional regulator